MESARDDRIELERLALRLAFAANGLAELDANSPLQPPELFDAAGGLRRQADALAAEVGDTDSVVRLARTVLDGLGRECAGLRVNRAS